MHVFNVYINFIYLEASAERDHPLISARLRICHLYSRADEGRGLHKGALPGPAEGVEAGIRGWQRGDRSSP